MSDAHFTSAQFDAFLTDISEAFIADDFDRWFRRLRLPFSMVTADGPLTLKTKEDARLNFELYREACDVMGLDLVHRSALEIEHCEDGTVLATYRTELLRNGKRCTAPYTSTALLHPDPQGWRMSAILNARGHHPWTGKHPKNSGV